MNNIKKFFSTTLMLQTSSLACIVTSVLVVAGVVGFALGKSTTDTNMIIQYKILDGTTDDYVILPKKPNNKYVTSGEYLRVVTAAAPSVKLSKFSDTHISRKVLAVEALRDGKVTREEYSVLEEADTFYLLE